eukprot:3170142-Amphidinium_carterae.2
MWFRPSARWDSTLCTLRGHVLVAKAQQDHHMVSVITRSGCTDREHVAKVQKGSDFMHTMGVLLQATDIAIEFKTESTAVDRAIDRSAHCSHQNVAAASAQ